MEEVDEPIKEELGTNPTMELAEEESSVEIHFFHKRVT
ncbi:MAG: hypothetical protein ACI9IP_000625 [Arcticibacterium sp.]|jgi:hypothetical protein